MSESSQKFRGIKNKKKYNRKPVKEESSEQSECEEHEPSDCEQESDCEPKSKTRGPGRPRKNPRRTPITRKGISPTPFEKNNIIELMYDQPMIFKKIFQFFKLLAAAQLQMIFRKDEVIIYTEDHHNYSRIRVRIDVSKINHYYCSGEIEIGIASRDMELIFNKIDKEYTSIVMSIDSSMRNRSIMVMFENDIKINEIHCVDLIAQYNKLNNEAAFTYENHMIKLECPSKYFRKTITEIKGLSKTLAISQENRLSPLIFEYITENRKIQSQHVITDQSRITLHSSLALPRSSKNTVASDARDTSFRIDINIDHIAPIAKSQIDDKIIVQIDEDCDFMTKTLIDGVFEIRTLTQLIKMGE